MSFIFEADHFPDRFMLFWNFNQFRSLVFLFEFTAERNGASEKAGSRSLIAFHIKNTFTNPLPFDFADSGQNREKASECGRLQERHLSYRASAERLVLVFIEHG